jgi:hypothetical protein
MARRDSEEPVALLTPEEREEGKTEPADIEADAGRSEAPKSQNLDHEYSVPSTVKFAWLGTYFFFSLALTLYNKLVLGMVCASKYTHPTPPCRPMATMVSSAAADLKPQSKTTKKEACN